MDAPLEVAPMVPPLLYKITLEVGDEDIDALGHVSNIAYVRWIQDVAIAHSSAVGLDLGAYGDLGAIFVVRRHEVDYLRPVLRGERVEVRTWIDRAFAAKCHRATEIVRVTDDAELVVAKAMTTWGFVEIRTGRPTRIPIEVRRAFLPDA
jgi:acyl-CoA thioester hydrolase